jgi:poly-beta-1,6-N-acetyl-D-glucosamine synthase
MNENRHVTSTIASADEGASPRYAVVSTVRNEQDFIAQTAEALLSQTVCPSAWLIVDDGSTDRTREILADYVQRFDWIRVVELGELAGSNRCGRIMRAFITGYNELEGRFDYIVKMDGDVTFEQDHLERLFSHFDEDSTLGIASGTYTEPAGRGWRTHTLPHGYAVGALRVYRAECLADVVGATAPMLRAVSADVSAPSGTPLPVLSWDSIDHLYSDEAGWTTRCFHELIIVHHRTEGARGGLLRGQRDQGTVSYVMGYHPLFVIVRALIRMRDYPFFIGAMAFISGYVTAALRPDIVRADSETRRLVRERQTRRIRDFIASRADSGGGTD